MATVYPNQLDTLLSLTGSVQGVRDSVTPISATNINTLASAMIQLETVLGNAHGLGGAPQSIYGTVANRLNILEQIVNQESGAGNVVVFGSAEIGQTIIWNGSVWTPGTNFINQNIQTSGELVSGPALSTANTTGLSQLTGKLILNAITPLKISDPNQGIIYFDQTAAQFLVSQNGGSYIPLVAGGGGNAGGDLAGLYPNPSVVRLSGANVPIGSSLTTGNVLQVDGYSSLTYGPINLGGGDGYVVGILPAENQGAQTLGGDLSGTTEAAFVLGLRGIPISPTSPNADQVLTYNGTYWIPSDIPVPTIYLSGDVVGPNTATVVENINGASVPPAGGLITGNVLQVTGFGSLGYGPLDLSGGSDYITGVLPAANQDAQSMFGDVHGSTNSSTVIAIQNIPVNSGSVSVGQAMFGTSFNEWGPATISGDIISSNVTPGLLTVGYLQGNYVPAGALVEGQFFVATSTNSWAPTTISGDISPSNTTPGQLSVTGIQGYSFSSFAPTKGQFVVATTGAGYGPVTISGDVSESGTIPGKLTVSGITGVTISGSPLAGNAIVATSGTAASWSNVTNIGGVTISGTPSANQVIVATSSTAASWQINSPTINGVTISGTPTTGQVLVALTSTTADWQTFGGAFAAGGDLSGTSSSQTVIKIQGTPVVNTAPTSNQLLQYNGTNWTPTTITLAGDVTGGLAATTVTKIQGHSVLSTAPSTGQVLEWNGSAWSPSNVTEIQGFPVSSATPQNQYTLIWDAADGYWKPESPLGGPPSGPASGDLSGFYPYPIVTGLDGYQIAFGDLGPDEQGWVVTWSYIDGYFILATPSSGPPSGMAGGDLSSAYPNPTVSKINGSSVPAGGALITGNVLQVTGTSALGYAPINLAGGANYITGLLPTASQAQQTMGGDLTGTTGSATVASIQGHVFTTSGTSPGYFIIANSTFGYQPVQITGDVAASVSTIGKLSVNALKGITLGGTTPSAGYILTSTSSTTADWVSPSSLGGSFTAGGDLSGSNTSQTVIGLRSHSVSATAPTTNQALIWSGSAWTPTTITLAGDVTGGTGATTVTALRGNTIQPGTLSSVNDGYALTWVNAASQWQPKAIVTSTIDGVLVSGVPTFGQVLTATSATTADWETPASGGPAGGDLTSNYPNPTIAKIQGNAVLTGTLGPAQDGYLLTWVSAFSEWRAEPPPGSFVPSGTGLVHIVSGVEQPAASLIVNADVDPSAAIAYSKLSLTGDIVNSDISSSAAIAYSKLNLTGDIVNTDIATAAAIAGTKINPAFGSQNISTTGTISTGSATFTAIKDSGLGTGVVHSDSFGNLSSFAVNLSGSDVTSTLPVENQAHQIMGQDVTGTTAAATVVALQTNPIQSGILSSIQDGYVLTWNGTVWLALALPETSGPPSGPAGGDLTGTYPNPTVQAIQGNMIEPGLLTITQDGYVLTWNHIANQWQPQAITAGSVTLAGDVSGPATSNTVHSINGSSVPTGGSLTIGTLLQVVGSSALSYAALNLANSNSVTGVLPAGNQAAQTLTGDVTGSTAADTISAIQGNPVLLGTLGSAQDGYVATWNGTDIVMLPVTATSVTMGGDITGPSETSTISSIQSNPVAFGTLGPAQDGYVATWNGTEFVMLPANGPEPITTTILNNVSANGAYGTPPTNWNASYTSGANSVIIYADAGGYTASVGEGLTLTLFIDGSPVVASSGFFNQSGIHGAFPSIAFGTTLTAGTHTFSLQMTGTGASADVNDFASITITEFVGGGVTAESVLLAGDVYGYSNANTVNRINGANVPAAGSLTTGNLLQVIGPSTLTYGALNLAGGSNFVSGVLPNTNQQAQTVGGDLSGTTNAATVAALSGNLLNLGTLGPSQDGYVVTWNSTDNALEALPLITGSATLFGDVTGPIATTLLSQIQGNPIDIGILGPSEDGYALIWSNTDSMFIMAPVTNEALELDGDVSGTLENNTVGFRKMFLLMGA